MLHGGVPCAWSRALHVCYVVVFGRCPFWCVLSLRYVASVEFSWFSSLPLCVVYIVYFILNCSVAVRAGTVCHCRTLKAKLHVPTANKRNVKACTVFSFVSRTCSTTMPAHSLRETHGHLDTLDAMGAPHWSLQRSDSPRFAGATPPPSDSLVAHCVPVDDDDVISLLQRCT